MFIDGTHPNVIWSKAKWDRMEASTIHIENLPKGRSMIQAPWPWNGTR